MTALGTRNYMSSDYNRLFSPRQVGSLLKPFIYLTAFKKEPDFSPLSLLQDAPATYSYGGGQTWAPQNYKKRYYGEVPAFLGLNWSLNAASVHLGMRLGLKAFQESLEEMGLKTSSKIYPSSLLGGLEVSPLNMAALYLELAQQALQASTGPLSALKEEPLLTESDKEGAAAAVMESEEEEAAVVVEKAQEGPLLLPASLTLGILQNAPRLGTAKSLQSFGFHFEVAAKTGTTNDYKDAWFVGITPQWLGLVWVGKDGGDPHGLTGASGALPIWGDFIQQAEAYLNNSQEPFFLWPAPLAQRPLKGDEIQQILEQIKVSPEEAKPEKIRERWRQQLSSAVLLFRK